MIIQTWYDISLEKEAGLKESLSSILFAISLIFGEGHYSVAEAAQKAGISPKTVQIALKTPQILNYAHILDVIAKTIYAEAQGESEDGKKAVASVIWNRANGNVANFEQVIKKRNQFSCWNGKVDLNPGRGVPWLESVRIARSMVAGEFSPTVEHTHYYNPEKADPSWAYTDKTRTKLRDHIDIGRHRFLTAQ